MQMKGSYEEGREDQFRQMMQEMTALEGKYKGVRGELLAKVRAELSKLKPTAATLSVVSAPRPVAMAGSYPSCRVCGRDMKPSASDGRLICQNGHSR
jgi:cytochrome c556